MPVARHPTPSRRAPDPRACLTMVAALAALTTLAPAPLAAQGVDARIWSDMRWRMIGPFRAGRTVAAVGIPDRPDVFYVGVNNGGVWKTDDAGRTWNPIFDDQPTGSIGAIGIAPSNPDIIYVGSGEGLQRPDLSTGDGMYKSVDGGRTWTHLGLRDAQQIAQVIVDPRDPNRLFVAVNGHPYGPNEERGIYRSTDGGATFTRILYRDENTGAAEVAFDPSNPQILYADLWAARQTPWEGGIDAGPGSGLFKSVDGGATWRQLTEGLPTVAQGLGRIGFSVAPSDPNRLYATVDAGPLGGIYRSDDAGGHWRRLTSQRRLWGRGSDFAEIRADPTNPDIVYVANTSTYKSTDGGTTWDAIKGAPGGDDYHRIWINPLHPGIILLGVDQGATITVNGGRTWSSWYNQPTAQFYHVITDDQFPYRVYGGQQESGSVGILSRGDDGAITFRDWHPVGAEEYAYVAPDPLHPNLIYAGKASRYDLRTGDVQNVAPSLLRDPRYRFVRTMPILFSPVDPHVLYLAGNVLFKTTNGGSSWSVISPDLSRPSYEVPKSLGVFAALDPEKGKHRGVIYAVAPSHKTVNTIWAGTDDGLIDVTRDGGKTWKNVTPPQLVPWAKVSQLDASHFDDSTVYAAINAFRLDDLRPHILRTHDGGATWTEIDTGLPDGAVINTVREDPERKGLLFAGSETQVWVSFDDGDHWQSLRLNMPATSIRDLVIHDGDIVVGTHGRSFWILDDIAALRQADARTASTDVVLFRPPLAYRVRRDRNTDTPLPPEEPAGQNPPDGAILDFWLAHGAAGPVTLEIRDSSQRVVRRYRSDDPVEPIDTALNVPTYWVRPDRSLAATAGAHRFIWDLRYPPLDTPHHEYPISAIVHDTPLEPLGPLVTPGVFTVTLTAGGRTASQPLTVKMDPRVTTPPAALARQLTLAKGLADAMHQTMDAVRAIDTLRARIARARAASPPAAIDSALAGLGRTLDTAAAGPGETAGGAGSRGALGSALLRLNEETAGVFDAIDGTDMAPTITATAAARTLLTRSARLLARWGGVRRDVPAVDAKLKAAGLPPIGTAAP